MSEMGMPHYGHFPAQNQPAEDWNVVIKTG